MFLSKLELNLQSKEVRRDVGNFYEMHRTLSRAYAVDDKVKPLRFLWRLEQVRQCTQIPVVLVQSSTPANWNALPANYFHSSPQTKQLDISSLLNETQFYFRLMANPTICRQGKRYGLLSEQEQLQWLVRQGLTKGFSVDSVAIKFSNKLQVKRDKVEMSIWGVLYEGILSVTDIQRLQLALIEGVGRAKSFGCGLLSIGKVR